MGVRAEGAKRRGKGEGQLPPLQKFWNIMHIIRATNSQRFGQRELHNMAR